MSGQRKVTKIKLSNKIHKVYKIEVAEKRLFFGRAHKGRALATRFPIIIGRAQTNAPSLTQHTIHNQELINKNIPIYFKSNYLYTKFLLHE